MTLHIKEQGVYTAGGIVQKAEGVFDPIHGQLADAGQVRYSDHCTVFYQLPEDGNGKKAAFLHGYGGSIVTWQRTPYAEGFADMFLEAGYGTYLIDQPRYGSAAKSSKDATVSARPDDLTWFTQFRLGSWPNYAEGTQMPHEEADIDQFFRLMTPSVGEFDAQLVTDTVVKALEKSGPAALITHSQGGIPGWFIAAASENVTGVIALEPGTFIMPEEECPAPYASNSAFAIPGAGIPCIPVPMTVFEQLIKKPIVVYFGDYIPKETVEFPAQDHWRAVLALARTFADCVNRHGGDAKVVYLPDEGIYGNSHFMFQEKNNREVFDHIHAWMQEKGI
jgi:pimeloyl-ACP methyl ester carboxylesterase